MVKTNHYDLDTDTTLGGNNASDYVIPSQKAIKSYVDNNTGTTVDQTFDGTSANAQSGVAIEGAGFIKNAASGTDCIGILGVTSSASIRSISIGKNSHAVGEGAISICSPRLLNLNWGAYADGAIQIGAGKNTNANTLQVGSYQLLDKYGVIPDARISTNIARSSDVADTTLSNVSSIDSNSAVQTALDGKVSKSGDTMTGHLAISEDAIAKIEFTNTSFDPTSTTAPASNVYAGAIDIFGSDNYHVGYFRTRHNTGNYFQSQMGVKRNVNNTDLEANITVAIDPNGTFSCTFPNTACVDGQWVKNFASLSTSSAVGTYNLTNTLKAQLPNDSYNYEILLTVNGRSTGSSQCSLKTAYTSEEYVLWLTANSRSAGTFIILPVDAARTLTQKVTGAAFSAIEIKLQAYRRIGTNS